MGALKRIAGPSVKFLGHQPGDVVRDFYRRCRAFLFPGEEDIGLTPIEAQASGRPVIAFGRGGALETVIGVQPATCGPEQATGVFFETQSWKSMAEAMLRFETFGERFRPRFIRAHVEQFDRRLFVEKMTRFIHEKVAEHQSLPKRPESRPSYAAGPPVR